MTSSQQLPSSLRRHAGFLAVQAIMLSALVALGVCGTQPFLHHRALPPLREQALAIRPLYDRPDVVSDEQLRRVLLRLRPQLHGPQTLLGDVDHALRCWGPDATFAEPPFVSGAELRGVLTDYRCYADLYGGRQPPLLIDCDCGVSVRTQDGLASTPHTDHTVACLAEVGTPLSFPVFTPGRTTTYRDMVEQALRDFQLDQVEYEWSAKLCVLFLPPTRQWWTEEGQRLSFDRLADRIMREALPRGVCWANHRLYTLVVFLRVDQEFSILSPGTRDRIQEFLGDATARLVEHQHAEGFWNDRWAEATPASRTPTKRDGDQLGDRILATGHALEWWAMAPEAFHPPRRVVVAAAQWLVRTIDGMSAAEIRQNYTFLSHAGRALAVWRGREPWQVVGPGGEDAAAVE